MDGAGGVGWGGGGLYPLKFHPTDIPTNFLRPYPVTILGHYSIGSVSASSCVSLSLLAET